MSKTKITAKMKAIQRKAQRYSKGLKRRATKAEVKLISELRKRGIAYKFQPFFFDKDRCYIADFAFSRYNRPRLIVEIDGKTHDSNHAKKYDAERTVWLMSNRNLEIIRFRNEDVFGDVQAVVDEIIKNGVRTSADLLFDLRGVCPRSLRRKYLLFSK